MAKVVIENMSGKSIEYQNGALSLLQVLLEHTDWMHACGGKGRCTTCRAQIVSGQEFLSEKTDAELKYINLRKMASNERLTCQVHVTGEVSITVPNDTKLPHLKYSE